jgi:hypothetical protein
MTKSFTQSPASTIPVAYTTSAIPAPQTASFVPQEKIPAERPSYPLSNPYSIPISYVPSGNYFNIPQYQQYGRT